MTLTRLFFILIFILSIQIINAQVTQTIRGTITDKQSESPLIGAAVQVVGSQPLLGAIADNDGNFEIKNVPTGRQEIQVSFIGYNASTIPNIVVNAGKETVLRVSLEENVTKLNAVTVSGKTEKTSTMNELATISARQFNVEEVQRFSGGRNDVSRLAANFAGVVIANDSRNDIVIRGNSPTGVLWRLEGIPIPNPNHFSTLGTTGGPVSALNPNMIRNSDFLTSAFPAEYGNANAGVFDIGLRNGNKDKFEVTAQIAAFSGFEAMAEGPFGKKGSFVVAYRYSFAEIANAVGLNIGTKAVPHYQDLTFNMDFGNSKFGKFSLFGLGGMSKIAFIGKDLDSTDVYAKTNEDSYADSKIGIIGLRHNFLIDNTSYIRTVISGSYSSNTYQAYKDKDGILKKQIIDVSDFTTAYRVSSFYNKKYNAKWTLRAGINFQNLQPNSDTRSRDTTPDWVQLRQFNGSLNLLELYAQTQFKPSDKFTFNFGLHTQYLDLNQKFAIEPRLAINYRLSNIQTLNFGYGLHSQIQPLPILLGRDKTADGSYQPTNTGLDFTRSNHFVIGYDIKPGGNWHTKVEAYVQLINNVPITSASSPSSYSVLNVGADFTFPVYPYLENKGTGTNKGIELTIEKFFSEGWYTLITTSAFDSKYKGSDGIERNTAFNGNYVFNALAGKEFKFGSKKQNAFTIDTKLTAAGGRAYTPINLEASKLKGNAVYYTDKAYSERYDPYFCWDVKLGYTLNSSKKKFTQQLFLDFQNVTGHKNIFQKQYSVERNAIYNVYQIGFFPDVLYRVQF